MPILERRDFWTEVFAIRGAVTPYVLRRTFAFGLIGLGVWLLVRHMQIETQVGIAPYEVVGGVLAILLVLRTNAGYDRWYEARKLWGGIVNQSRNLGLIAVTYGPDDEKWRDQFIRWTAAFSHTCRLSLRGETDEPVLRELLGSEAEAVERAQHMPLYVSTRIGALLRVAVDEGQLDRFAFLEAERERSQLIDHIGACERIMKTPLARVFSIKIRRFLFLFLSSLPVALVDKTGWLTPMITALVAYPLVSLDQIGIELQNPFSRARLSHLPLTEICHSIQQNLFGLQEAAEQSFAALARDEVGAAVTARAS